MRLECHILIQDNEVLDTSTEVRANIETEYITHWCETTHGTLLMDESGVGLYTVARPDYDHLNKILLNAKKNEGIFYNSVKG